MSYKRPHLNNYIVIFIFCMLFLSCKNNGFIQNRNLDLLDSLELKSIDVNYPNFFNEFNYLTTNNQSLDSVLLDLTYLHDTFNAYNAVVLMGSLIASAYYNLQINNHELNTELVKLFNNLCLRLDTGRLTNFHNPFLSDDSFLSKESIIKTYYTKFLINNNNEHLFIFKNCPDYNSLLHSGFILNKWLLILNSSNSKNSDFFLKYPLIEIRQALTILQYDVKLPKDIIDSLNIYEEKVDSIVVNDSPYRIDTIQEMIVKDEYVDRNGVVISENAYYQELYNHFIDYLIYIRFWFLSNIN